MKAMQGSGLVESVIRRIEAALLDGSFPANSRLPSERAMAERYDVSRNTIREAIQRLTARGLVSSRHGVGVFVTDQLRTGSSTPWGQLVADSPAMRGDVLEFRRVLEGATAYFAALRGDQEDHARIHAALDALEQARRKNDPAAEAAADSRLHEAIALASHNAMFLHLHASVISMLREHITLSGNNLRALEDGVAEQLLIQHRAICKTICAHQPEEARTAMQAHIDFVANGLDS